jgi:hypothetical protein
MIDADLGDTPLGVIAGPLICLGFNSYYCNVVIIDTPICCLASCVLVQIHRFFH